MDDLIRYSGQLSYIFLKPIGEKASLENTIIECVSFIKGDEVKKYFSNLIKEKEGMEVF